MIKYRLLEFKDFKEYWKNNPSYTREFYSARALKEEFASRLGDDDVKTMQLGIERGNYILKHTGVFQDTIYFKAKKSGTVWKFEKEDKPGNKYHIEDIAELVLRRAIETNIYITALKVPLYCFYIKQHYLNNGIDIMEEKFEEYGNGPRNKRLQDLIGTLNMEPYKFEHSKDENGYYFKMPLKDKIKYTPLAIEDEEIIVGLLDQLFQKGYFKLLDEYYKGAKNSF